MPVLAGIYLLKELEGAKLDVKDGGRHQKLQPVQPELVLQQEEMTGHPDRELIRPKFISLSR